MTLKTKQRRQVNSLLIYHNPKTTNYRQPLSYLEGKQSSKRCADLAKFNKSKSKRCRQSITKSGNSYRLMKWLAHGNKTTKTMKMQLRTSWFEEQRRKWSNSRAAHFCQSQRSHPSYKDQNQTRAKLTPTFTSNSKYQTIIWAGRSRSNTRVQPITIQAIKPSTSKWCHRGVVHRRSTMLSG